MYYKTADLLGEPASYPMAHSGLKSGSQGLTAGAVVRQSEQAPKVIVSGFSRYAKEARLLPREAQEKIDRLARGIVEQYRPGRRPLQTIHFVGHADRDSPPRPAFEQRISEERALEIKNAVLSSVDRQADSLLLGPVFPPISQRLSFQIVGKGATQLAVPNACAEHERARNRRVEMFLSSPERNDRVAITTVSRINPASFRNVVPRSNLSPIETAIQDFCVRGKALEIDEKGLRRNCFAAASAAARNLGCRSPLEACCKLSISGSQLVKSKKYHDQCNSKGTGRFLEVIYHPLANVVKQLQCALDNGCVVKAGVLSGICDDKPDLGCKRELEKRQMGHLVWRDCPEHWLLIFGHEISRGVFVFYDSAGTSAMSPCELYKQIGLLHFDNVTNRLSTAMKNIPGGLDHMEVAPDGYHTNQNLKHAPGSDGQISSIRTQKRYQVLMLRACLL